MLSINFLKAWQVAAEDLQIKIQSPFIFEFSTNKTLQFDLFVEDFGNQLGTIVFQMDQMTKFANAKSYGFYCSALNPENYSTYKRDYFIDTLNDWGYFGDVLKKPNWYNGHLY